MKELSSMCQLQPGGGEDHGPQHGISISLNDLTCSEPCGAEGLEGRRAAALVRERSLELQ